MLAINPDECIDCALCVPECPVDAIYADDDLPPEQAEFLVLNATLAESWPNITESQLPLPEAEEWKDKPNKRQWLEKEWNK
jgi:ferredoxin